MGLIKAITGAVGGVLADQWKEFFYCDALDSDTLMVKGQKRVSGRSSNTRGSENVISNGSGIAVADGQCMIIVDQGKIVEFCAEPGQFTYDTSTEPSILTGDLGDAIMDTFAAVAAASPTAVTPARIREFIISTPRRSWATSSAPPAPSSSRS